MLYKLLFFIACFLHLNVYSQSLTPAVIASGGGYSSSGNGSLSFTIGETSITTLSTSTSILTQGFQQSGTVTTGIWKPGKSSSFEVNCYPNPTRDELSIDIKSEKRGDVRIDIFDMLGKRLGNFSEFSMMQETHSISGQLGHYSPGSYFLKISMTTEDGHTDYSIFQIIIF